MHWNQAPGQASRAARFCRGSLLLLPFALGVSSAQAANLVVAVQQAPSVLPTTAARVLVYELNVRNLDSTACARLVDVHMRGGSGNSAIEQHYQGWAIPGNTSVYARDMTKVPDPMPGAAPPASPPPVDLPAGGGAAIFFYVLLGEGNPAPSVLTHTLKFGSCTGASTTQTLAYDVPVRHEPPVVLGLPFRGAGWVAGDSVNAKGTHRRTMIPIRDAAGKPLAGQFHVPERYAIDWIVVDEEGRRAIGPIDHNASYLAYGKAVVAVADGVISRTRDHMPEQTPPYSPTGQTMETAAGNFIMEDIGGGRYAFYAHLQPGKLKVAEGAHVKRGQVLAILGNSGNSTEAHLHFHVSNANEPLLSEGLPFVFDHFDQTGQVDGMNEETGLFDDDLHYAPIERKARMPASYSVLTTSTAPDGVLLPPPPQRIIPASGRTRP